MELAARYRDEGADELVFYDITASPEGRSVDREWVRRVARVLDIPFCVAGGIRSVPDAEEILNAGAEKVSVNSPALANPGLIDALSARFGSQFADYPELRVELISRTIVGEFVVQEEVVTGRGAHHRHVAVYLIEDGLIRRERLFR